jgi:hypothetical protein
LEIAVLSALILIITIAKRRIGYDDNNDNILCYYMGKYYLLLVDCSN